MLHGGADDEVFTLDLHPRLTVISGAGRLEREGLINEVVGSLGSSRPGVHLELVDDRSRSLAVFRPDGARHRVIDVDEGVDVTAEFERNGSIDLLAAAEIPAEQMGRALCVTGSELSNEANHDDVIRRLGVLPAEGLWEAAAALREVQAELVRVTGDAASTPVDAELVGLIDAKHGELQQAVERLESVRSSTFVLGAALTLFAVLSMLFASAGLAVPMLVGAAASTGLSLRRWLDVRRASAAEDEMLRSAGMSSYLTFQLHRVNGLVSCSDERQRLVELSQIHQEALACWRAVAGDVDVDWAWRNRAEIERAGMTRVEGFATPGNGLATSLSCRLRAVRGWSLRPPVLLDEPFITAGDDELRDLISLVLAATDHLQLLLLTNDPRIASWASLEQMRGTITHLELGSDEPVAAPAAAAAAQAPQVDGNPHAVR